LQPWWTVRKQKKGCASRTTWIQILSLMYCFPHLSVFH